ncbi:MAG: hypothetical protein QME12_09265, partial [Nanoarchaeota archaeon]|nr:hypothetical protein [Nanoarchaeota archaeon]
AKLLSVALKLESLKIEFDKIVRTVKSIAEYYESTGNMAEADKFNRVAGLFNGAKEKIDEIKAKLRENANTMTKENLMEIKHDVKYIAEVVMQDALYIVLGGEVKLEGAGMTEEGYADCGTDMKCYAEAFRLCEPVVWEFGGEGKGRIYGAEGDVCLLEASYQDKSLFCKIKNYATIGSEPQNFIQYCEGALADMIRDELGAGAIKPEPGKKTGACVDRCGDRICQEMVCMADGCPCAESLESCPNDCSAMHEDFVMCTPEDEESVKACRERGGKLQTDPSRYKHCEIYKGCLAPEEYKIPLPWFMEEIQKLGTVTMIDFETLPDGTLMYNHKRLTGKEWESLGVVFEAPSEDFMQVFGPQHPFNPLGRLSLSPGLGPFEAGGDTHDDLNIIFSEPVKAAGLYLLDMGETNERESIAFIDKEGNVIEKVSPWPKATFGNPIPGTFVGIVHEAGISEIQILENPGDSDDIAYDNLYFVR